MSKRLFIIVTVAALLMPAVLRAQVIGNTIPKMEFSVGGGVGYGGYATSMPGSPWMTHVAQDPEGIDYMKFFLPKAQMFVAGHAGVYMDYHFTDNWGLITGLEFGVYYTNIHSDNLLNVSSHLSADRRPIAAPARPITRADGEKDWYEDWIGANLPNYDEKHRMFALQIPVMAKYMIPISPAGGHQYYVAAGAKVGIRVLKECNQSFDFGQFDNFARRHYPYDPTKWSFLHTDGGNPPYTVILPQTKYEVYPKDYYDETYKVKASPIDVMAAFDTGFRWNLGRGWGLYTGLYCDFGLIRAVGREKGCKVLTFDENQVQMTGGDVITVGLQDAKVVSVLAADAPDYCYKDVVYQNADYVLEDVWVKNDKPMSKIANAMQAGLKLRVSFGKVAKVEKKVKEPKEPKTKKVPKEIKQTMIELSDALFAFDKFTLNDQSRALLDKVAEWLKDNPDLNVEIAGHTDDRGSDAYNQKLSENRAKAVYDYLTSHGISKSRLSYKGYGESQPIATNETDEGRQKNRRVELHIL